MISHRLQGNHYCARDYGSSASNQNSYHYSNTYAVCLASYDPQPY
jgi:hypothetical protein